MMSSLKDANSRALVLARRPVGKMAQRSSSGRDQSRSTSRTVPFFSSALPDYLVDLYRNVFKNDLAVVNGDASWTLPMPARFVIGQDGTILYAEVNPDYMRRPDPEELIPVLDRARIAA